MKDLLVLLQYNTIKDFLYFLLIFNFMIIITKLQMFRKKHIFETFNQHFLCCIERMSDIKEALNRVLGS